MEKLLARNISISFDDKQILNDVNIKLNPGELVCLLGISGSGKTTLFNILSGILSPTSGEVLLNGQDITNKPGSISYMLQKDLLLPYKTILNNVILPLTIKGMSKNAAQREALPFFEEFGLSDCENKYPSQLSGGMRQRAALLRTYLFSSEVALLDEPFSALDTITKSTMHKWYLDVMKKIQLSTLFITHDIDEAILLSDRIYIMSGNPSTITKEIIIKEGKNKEKNFIVSEEFLNYKREIINFLNL